MNVVGLSREGCWTMLVLSIFVLLLADVFMYHDLGVDADRAPFIALIAICITRLLRRERQKPA